MTRERLQAHRGGAEDAEKRFFFKNNLRALRASAVCFCLSCAAPRAEMAKVELRGAEAAELSVDGAPAGKMQAKTRLSVRPGHHVFEVRLADGTVQVREADVGPGDFIALDLGGKK